MVVSWWLVGSLFIFLLFGSSLFSVQTCTYVSRKLILCPSSVQAGLLPTGNWWRLDTHADLQRTCKQVEICPRMRRTRGRRMAACAARPPYRWVCMAVCAARPPYRGGGMFAGGRRFTGGGLWMADGGASGADAPPKNEEGMAARPCLSLCGVFYRIRRPIRTFLNAEQRTTEQKENEQRTYQPPTDYQLTTD